MTRTANPSTTTDAVAAFENRPNQALARCIEAWQRTYDLAYDEPEDESLAPDDDDDTNFAYRQAAIAFREAMPPLAGYENIRDFIACIAYAILKRIFSKEECEHLNNVAKLALALLRVAPKDPAPAKP
jgi:hypothetical protein